MTSIIYLTYFIPFAKLIVKSLLSCFLYQYLSISNSNFFHCYLKSSYSSSSFYLDSLQFVYYIIPINLLFSSSESLFFVWLLLILLLYEGILIFLPDFFLFLSSLLSLSTDALLVFLLLDDLLLTPFYCNPSFLLFKNCEEFINFFWLMPYFYLDFFKLSL